MLRWAVVICAVIVGVAVLVITIRRPDGDAQDPGTVTFESVSRTARSPFGFLDSQRYWFRIQIGGDPTQIKLPTPSDPFPASLFMHPPCSATLIGEHVLLTAGHCLGSHRKAAVKLADGQTSAGPCEVFQTGTSPDFDVDIALCRMNTAISKTVFETLASDTDPLNVGDEVMLTGYGKNAQFEEAFLIGLTNVARIAGSVLVTSEKTYLTSGDSGGAVYRIYGNDRRIVAINSRVAPPESFATLVVPIKSTMVGWQDSASTALKKKVFICGYDDNPACKPQP